MKTLIKLTLTVTMLLASVALSNAQGYHWVNPHYDRNGVSYRGHYQTNPDGNPYNNFGRGGSYPYFIY